MSPPARTAGDVPAMVAEARAERLAGRREAALALFQEAATLAPGHLGLRMEAAFDLRGLGRLAEAAATYEALLARAPGHAGALLGLAACHRQRGDLEAALAGYTAASAADPAHQGARLERAAILRELGRTAEARAALAPLAATSDQPAVLIAQAVLERLDGQREAARGLLQRAVAADPHHVAARLELATELREMGDTAAARDAAEAVLATDPDSVPALLSLGLTARATRCHAAALDAFARAHAAQPGRADIVMQMALEHRALGRQAECDTLLARALALEPDNVAVLVQHAEQARMANDVAAVHAIYEAALPRHPAELAINLGYAEALALLGRADEALGHLGRLPARATAVRLKRISLLRRAGRWPEALDLARAAVADEPGAFGLWMERLMLEAELGSDADIAACAAAVPARTAAERARLARTLARMREDRGDRATALDLCAQADALEPGVAETQFLITRLRLGSLDLPGARQSLRAYASLTAPSTRLRGRSPNPSQTHFGQLLDEFALDQATVDAVLALRAAELPARIEALLALVRATPDSTSAAMALLDALRQDGKVGGPPLSGEDWSPHIPRTVLQFWDKASVPPDVSSLMEGWRACPGFAHSLFDDDAAESFIAATYGARPAGVFARVRGGAQKADVFRLAYLAARGGVYVDADDRRIGPLAAVVPPWARLVLYQEDIGTLGNNFIAACPRHPLMVQAFRLALTALARGDEDAVWLSTGPALLTRTFARLLAGAGPGWAGWFDTTRILARRDLSRAVAIHCLTGYKATTLHWGNEAQARRGKP